MKIRLALANLYLWEILNSIMKEEMNMRVLVIRGAGFIGSHLVDALMRRS